MYMELLIILIQIVIGNPTNGATTGCHCHFTIRKGGELINPLEILKTKGEYA